MRRENINLSIHMGSVSVDYRCPWCDRVGNGGYAPDGINEPICTDGRYSCLWHHFMYLGRRARWEVKLPRLIAVLCLHNPDSHTWSAEQRTLHVVLSNIVAFI